MQLVTALPPGTILGEPAKYKILGVCGQGGFGITYTGWDISLERNVAIKECFPQEICVRDGENLEITPRTPALQEAYLAAMADLQKEARLLAGLNHPNIVQVHDVFAANGSLFCVMHWLEGDTLRDRLDTAEAAGAPIPPEQAEAWLRQLLDALGYMHAQGVVHRDIKPENIMFDESGRPVLVDFGSAANISHLTHTLTQGAFSAAYAAPEQISGKGEIGPWTDFYSLAATWYEVFSNCAAEETVRRMMEDSLKPLERLVPERVHAAPRMAAGIMRNLELRSANRCRSAAEWLAMLNGNRKARMRGKARMNHGALPWLAVPAVLLLGLYWLGSALEDVSPAPAEPQATPAAVGEPDMESLYRQAKEHYNVDALFARHGEIRREAQALLEGYRAEIDQLERGEMREMTTADHAKLSRLSHDTRHKMESLAKERGAKLRELEKQNRTEVVQPFMAGMNELEMNKGWSGLSTAEKVALPQVADRIRKEQYSHSGPDGITVLINTEDWASVLGDAEMRLNEAESKRLDGFYAQ